MTLKTVNKIDESLCSGCGTCAGICPQNAITLMIDKEKGIYIPNVDNSKCNLCHLCVDICSGISVDFNELNQHIFSKIPDNMFLGNFVKCYVGHSTDYKIRYNASSGGLVSTLLSFGIKNGIFDGVLVTRMNSNNCLLPEPFIARNSNDILESQTSRYQPVPVNIMLKEILKENGTYAVVGLPCHIEAIRKAQVHIPKLRQRIKLLIGLFCGGSQNIHMTQTLLNRVNVNPQDVINFKFRGNGCPGKIEIILRSGKTITLDFLTYYTALGTGWFSPLRCMTCPDATNELADLSFGDAWKFQKDDKVGSSLVIVRNQTGLDFVNDAISNKKIQLLEVSPQAVIESQIGMLNNKKKQFIPSLLMARLFNQKTPQYKVKLPKNSLLDYAIALRYALTFLCKNYTRNLLVYVPLRLLHIYQYAITGLLRL